MLLLQQRSVTPMHTLNEKIKELLVQKEISPSRFADEIGVQRSSISHILSGRNKPSFDIIQKILRRYPDLGMDWFLSDTSESDPNLLTATGKLSSIRHTEKKTPGLPNTKILLPPDHLSGPSWPANKEIERILIFYKDKTFSEYTPS